MSDLAFRQSPLTSTGFVQEAPSAVLLAEPGSFRQPVIISDNMPIDEELLQELLRKEESTARTLPTEPQPPSPNTSIPVPPRADKNVPGP